MDHGCYDVLFRKYARLFEIHDRDARVPFAKFGEMVGFDVFLTAQIFVDAFSEGAGPFSVDDADCVEMREQRIVKIFIQLSDCLVHSFSEKVDLRADRKGFTHSDPSL